MTPTRSALLVASTLLAACIPALEDLDGGTSSAVPAGYSLDADVDNYAAGLDCDDSQPTVNPGAQDTFGDGIDQNCDGYDGVDADDDRVASIASGGTDCDDTDARRLPGAADTSVDTLDQDCDGVDGPDVDRDGAAAYAAGGTDCNDGNAEIHPGADDPFGDNIDQDCSGLDGAGYEDRDGDGVDAETAGGIDCDDGNPAVHPGQPDAVGDGVDQDCDGLDGVDRDRDGAAATWSGGTDCDDTQAGVHPDAEDADVDDVDQDCDGVDGPDADADGYAAQYAGGTDCDDTDANVNPGVADLLLDGTDDDCDNADGEDAEVTLPEDLDGDGYADVAFGGDDCDDADRTVHPAALETCDGIDNDCDGLTDDADLVAVNQQSSWYRDTDGDGWGASGALLRSCLPPGGYVSAGGDCDEADAAVNPGAAEVCDGIDNDCDGRADAADRDIPDSELGTYYVDADGDGVGRDDVSVRECAAPRGFASTPGDCDDNDRSTYPGAAREEPFLCASDADGDGWGARRILEGDVRGGTDCDDESPYAGSVLDDADCDGVLPEGCSVTLTVTLDGAPLHTRAVAFDGTLPAMWTPMLHARGASPAGTRFDDFEAWDTLPQPPTRLADSSFDLRAGSTASDWLAFAADGSADARVAGGVGVADASESYFVFGETLSGFRGLRPEVHVSFGAQTDAVGIGMADLSTESGTPLFYGSLCTAGACGVPVATAAVGVSLDAGGLTEERRVVVMLPADIELDGLEGRLGLTMSPSPECYDADGDGQAPLAAGGTDCDDADPNVHADRDLPDVCGVDADADGLVTLADGGTDCDEERAGRGSCAVSAGQVAWPSFTFNATTGWTVEAWVYAGSANADSGHLFRTQGCNGAKGTFTYYGPHTVPDGQGFFASGDPSTPRAQTGFNVHTEEWVHVAATYTASASTLYVAGQRIGSGTGTTSGTCDALHPASTGLAGNLLLDSLRISDGVLYTGSSFTPPVVLESRPGTKALYRFDEGFGASTQDASGNGRGGTWTDAPTWVPGRALRDDDGDGYIATSSGGPDCDDRDDQVKPFAGDAYNDGVDSDCDGMDCEASYNGTTYVAACPAAEEPAQASSRCTAAGYDRLLEIRTADEQAFFADLTSTLPYSYWIGLTRAPPGTTWSWPSGAALSYTHWATYEPSMTQSGDGPCVMFWGSSAGSSYAYGWNDAQCTGKVTDGGYGIGAACELRR